MRNKRISQTGVGQSEWYVLDEKGGADFAVQIEPNANTITIQATLDPSLKDGSDSVAADQILSITDIINQTANNIFSIKGPVRGIRINQTIGTGTSSLTILQNDN